MVHQLQQAILTMLTASQPDKCGVAPMQTSTDHSSHSAITVLHEGDAENAAPEIGNVVKVEYQLVLDSVDQKALAPEGPEPAVEEGKSANPSAVFGESNPFPAFLCFDMGQVAVEQQGVGLPCKPPLLICRL